MGDLRRAFFVGCIALGLCTWGGRASASSFQLIEQNASGLGNAYAGQAAVAEDASTIFYNPAGMTQVPGFQLSAGINFVDITSEFKDNGSTPATLQPTLGGTGGNAGSLQPVPNGYFSAEVLKDVLWAGVGVSVPFGLKTEWDADWMGRFHAVKSDVKTININPAVAWKISDFISVGAGLNVQYISAELTNSANYSAIAAGAGAAAGGQAGAAAALAAVAATCPGAGPTGAGCEGLATVKGSTWTAGWNLGLLLSFPSETRFGFSYRSKVKHSIGGTVTFANRPPPLAAGLPDGDITANIELPDTASLAVTQRLFSRLQLLADFTWTGWSSLQDLSIYRTSGAGLASTPLKFKDSLRFGLGANYQLTEAWKLRAGVAFDQTPVQDAYRTPRLPDQDRTWVAGGVQWALTKSAAVDVGFAYLFIKDASSNLPNLDPAPPAGFTATPRGNLVGTYPAHVWIAGLQARYTF